MGVIPVVIGPVLIYFYVACVCVRVLSCSVGFGVFHSAIIPLEKDNSYVSGLRLFPWRFFFKFVLSGNELPGEDCDGQCEIMIVLVFRFLFYYYYSC